MHPKYIFSGAFSSPLSAGFLHLIYCRLLPLLLLQEERERALSVQPYCKITQANEATAGIRPALKVDNLNVTFTPQC